MIMPETLKDLAAQKVEAMKNSDHAKEISLG